jgi:hypothetical protein
VLEYQQALTSTRPPGVTVVDIAALLDYLCLEAQLQEVFYLWRPHLSDPKDDLVLEAAVAGNCAGGDDIVLHVFATRGEVKCD